SAAPATLEVTPVEAPVIEIVAVEPASVEPAAVETAVEPAGAIEPTATVEPASAAPATAVEPDTAPTVAASPSQPRRRDRRIPAAPRARRTERAGVRPWAARDPRAAATRPPLGRRLMSVGAMLFSAALLVGLTVPANAFFPESPATAETMTRPDGSVTLQNLEVAATVQADAVARERWGVTSWAQMLQAEYGAPNYSYTVGSGSVRWPFPTAVSISDGYGYRVSPCAGCSSNHQGTDFTPGDGAAIYAIADGVVTTHDDGNGGFGNYVVLTHRINGQTITSTYAHMQRGSSPLSAGQVIKVGDFIGLVGSTGASVGSHLHLEIALGGVKVDPFAWLKANAN
ncbi:MAG: peptidoglycan DD-metalloendopeptidase family protein, partial [Microbacteriaceae bacterium]